MYGTQPFSRMNPHFCLLLFFADSQAVKFKKPKKKRGLSGLHIGPLWHPMAPADVSIFLSSSLKRCQMFIHNVADKEHELLRQLLMIRID